MATIYRKHFLYNCFSPFELCISHFTKYLKKHWFQLVPDSYCVRKLDMSQRGFNLSVCGWVGPAKWKLSIRHYFQVVVFIFHCFPNQKISNWFSGNLPYKNRRFSQRSAVRFDSGGTKVVHILYLVLGWSSQGLRWTFLPLSLALPLLSDH